MPRPKKSVEEQKPEEKAEVSTKTARNSDVKEVSVFDNYGNFVRKYSLADHGDDFVKLAYTFIADRANYSIK